MLLISNQISGTQDFDGKNNFDDIIEESVVFFIADPLLTDKADIQEFEEPHNFLIIPVDENSFQENAHRILFYADSLSIANYHIVGEGIGGSVAMHVASADSNRILSLTLINANGIEELELLGGYHLNNAIYQVRILWNNFLKVAIPHFGLFKSLDVKIIRYRSQSNSDQRQIRDILKEISIPVSILHTPKSKVTESVSKEHHRLLPQSELSVITEHDWLFIFDQFKTRVDQNIAVSRSMVSKLAQQESLKPFDPNNSVKAEGGALILLMLIIILSTLISEDLTCIGTGLMIARGLVGFFPGTLACLIGIFFGDILLYLMGRWLASSTLHRAPLKWFISEKDIQLSYHWFEAKGPSIIIASRFIPGTRFPTYFSAGAIGASFGMFMFYFGIASIIWTPILVGLAVLLGQEMSEYFALYQDYALWVLFGVLAILFVLFKVIIPSFTYRGRRLLIGWYKRKRHWEFWSPFVVYAPVLLYTVFLWVKYRSITLATLVNPGFRDGGFIKESKSEILDKISLQDFVADYQLVRKGVSFDEKRNKIKEFMDLHHLEFPIVLKPDVGQRGHGVVIPKNSTQLDIELRKLEEDFIIQKYIQGEEYGIFYFRLPNEPKGRIYSITSKKYMWLTGDGKHTLEELILKDSRAVCLAEKHFEQHVDELFTIPAKGKKIPLVEVGTHARGSIFLDGIQLKTDLLEAKIEEISDSIDGFYFGRFDIKVPSFQHLKEGNELKVLEVNGLTSEATHIYDPKYNFFYGVKVLMNQWNLAYEIASQVRNQNPELKPPGPIHILNLLR